MGEDSFTMEKELTRQLYNFLYNPLFLSALASWMISQLLKVIIGLIFHSVTSTKQFLELLFWRTGGMPSSHSALVSSVTTAIAFKNGIASDLFVFSCCFALVVIRDSMGVRRSSGQQAKALNDLGSRVADKLKVQFKPVKEIQGHKPIEVFAGLLLGFFIGVAFSTL